MYLLELSGAVVASPAVLSMLVGLCWMELFPARLMRAGACVSPLPKTGRHGRTSGFGRPRLAVETFSARARLKMSHVPRGWEMIRISVPAIKFEPLAAKQQNSI